MKKFNQKILTGTFTFFIVLLLSISIILANNVKNEDKEIDEEKIYYQIKYIDNEIIYMSNFLNINETQIDWKQLQENINNLYNYWNSAILDFNNLNVEKMHLTDFGKKLDNLALSIKYKNKKDSLINLIEIYKKIIIYLDNLNYENYKSVLITKYNLLLASSILETENWTLIHEYILRASDNLYKVFNKIDINLYEQYNINQAYVAVKEMENLISIKDIDVFYIKCKIALDKLEIL